MEALAAEEVRLLTERLAGMEPERACSSSIAAGTEPLNDLLSALSHARRFSPSSSASPESRAA